MFIFFSDCWVHEKRRKGREISLSLQRLAENAILCVFAVVGKVRYPSSRSGNNENSCPRRTDSIPGTCLSVGLTAVAKIVATTMLIFSCVSSFPRLLLVAVAESSSPFAPDRYLQ
jgi:hypothetical protein